MKSISILMFFALSLVNLQANQFPHVNLIVSDTFTKIFPDMEDKYNQKNTIKLFNQMNYTGNLVCNMINGQLTRNEKIIDNFSEQLWTKKYDAFISGLISGCFNFIKMNDLKVRESFIKILSFYPDEQLNCYTVGYSQVYFMHSILHCNRLTAIDIDWRILYFHLQTIIGFQNNEFTASNISSYLKKINFGWSAFTRPIQKEKNIGFHTICDNSEMKICRKQFIEFQNIYTDLDEIELQLAFLHDIKINDNKLTAIINVSNAIDPEYTTKKQFTILLKNISSHLKDKKQKTIVIYHGGGSSQIAIYEIRKYMNVLTVKTMCRDELEWAQFYNTRGRKYNTYFDDISKTDNAESCS